MILAGFSVIMGMVNSCNRGNCKNTVSGISPKTGRPFHYCDSCRESEKVRKREFYKRNKSKWAKSNEQTKARWHKLRSDFLKLYGGVCVCCGESEPKFLTLDHVNNDGKKHRSQSGNFKIYQDAIAVRDDTRFQILCWNCNCAKGSWGVCPHQLVLKT